MPDPLVTTNPADYTKLEGVYISPTDPPPFVKEVGLSTVGIFGTTLRGPTGKTVDISSAREFKDIYGLDRHAAGGPTIQSEVWKALLNKRFGKLVIYRVAASDAVKGSFTLEDTAGGAGAEIIRIDAMSAGLYGADVFWKVEAATDADGDHWNLRIKYKGEEFLYENLDTSATGNDNTLSVIGTADSRLIDLVKIADGRPVNSVATVDGADADGFTFLGQVVAGFTSVVASDGTIAASDYTATDGPLDTLADKRGVGILFCANEDGAFTATINAQMLVKAAASSDRDFLIHEGALTGITPAAAISDVANFRSDRIFYCYNAPFTIDPQVAAEVQTAPQSWMASILALTDVDVNPGEENTKKLLAGITRIDLELNRQNYIDLRAAGIAALEKDTDGSHIFVSGVTASLESGKDQITRRRSADFIQLGAAGFAKPFVKKKGTTGNTNQLAGGLRSWLEGLKNEERIVKEYSVNSDDVNDDQTEAQGLFFIEIKVRLINHMLFVVLLTEIGTGTVIETQ